jgi:hypothetical protein
MIKIEKGKKITERSFKILIADKSQNGYAEIRAYPSQDDKFHLLYANVLNTDGSIERKFKAKDISTTNYRSRGSFYEDRLVKQFDLYHDEYPYIIEYAYQIEEKEFLNVANWKPLLYSNASVLQATLRVECPKDYEVNIDQTGEQLTATEATSGNTTIWTWKATNIKGGDREYFAPSIWETTPSVTVAPADFQYGIAGSNRSWEDFGDWQVKLNEGTEELPTSEQQRIDELLFGVTDDREKVRILYHYLQDHNKYVNVTIDEGGFKSYPAAYVCENKFGDCKALTTYMKAMLQYADIPAYYTLVYAGGTAPEVNPNFVATQFNHVILMIPLAKDTIWLENTSNINPFNYLGDFTQDRWALKVDAGNSELIRTPALKPEDVLHESSYHFSFDASGTGEVQVARTLRNNAFERYLSYQELGKEDDQRELVASNIHVKEFDLTDWAIEQEHRDVAAIQVKASGSCTQQIREVGSLKAFQPPGLQLPRMEKPAQRKQAVRIQYPRHRIDSFIYDLPFLTQHEVQLPAAINIETTAGQFKLTAERIADDRLVIYRNYLLNEGTYTIEEYEMVYDFIKAVEKQQKQFVIILKHKS